MKSLKPGRMTSIQEFVGSIFAVVVGIMWLFFVTSSMSEAEDIPPAFFYFFVSLGFVIIITGIVKAVLSYKNAFGKNRYSLLDITDSSEEPDPFNFKNDSSITDTMLYCPHCGTSIKKDYDFCPGCGRKLK